MFHDKFSNIQVLEGQNIWLLDQLNTQTLKLKTDLKYFNICQIKWSNVQIVISAIHRC